MSTFIPWSAALKTIAGQFADLEAVSDGEHDLSFRALVGRASAVAERLLDIGIKPGEPVATFLRNGLAAVWASYGITISGAAEASLNPALTRDERRYCVNLAGIKRVVTTAEEAPFFQSLGCETFAIETLGDPWGDAASIPPVDGEAWGRIIFTSGTTGRPKAIVHTHDGRWLANLLQQASLTIAPAPGIRVLLMTSFAHGASLTAYAYLDKGAGIVLLDGVDLPKVERALAAGVDHVFAPPTVLAKLVSAFEGRRFSDVRLIFCGTSTLTPTLYRRARAIFGPTIRVTYGKSEIVNPITVMPAAAADRYYTEEIAGDGTCVGWPASGVEVEIRRADGARCALDEVGEVQLRARHMLGGDLDERGFHPQAPHGHHATGDLGRIDAQGRLHLVGRLADVIKSGGYKIYPEEIERVLAETATAVVVTTLPSEYWGEVIVAVAENAPPGWEAAASSAVTTLAKYKWPRAYVSVERLPRNPQGKVPRAKVREIILARYTLADGPRPTLVRR